MAALCPNRLVVSIEAPGSMSAMVVLEQLVAFYGQSYDVTVPDDVKRHGC
jgi:hypothetical protein